MCLCPLFSDAVQVQHHCKLPPNFCSLSLEGNPRNLWQINFQQLWSHLKGNRQWLVTLQRRIHRLGAWRQSTQLADVRRDGKPWGDSTIGNGGEEEFCVFFQSKVCSFSAQSHGIEKDGWNVHGNVHPISITAQHSLACTSAVPPPPSHLCLTDHGTALAQF